jgi:DNA-dependent RNA polymerase auxiliary subunit epsilon
MKTSSIFIAFCFCLAFLYSSPQGQIIRLNLKEGETYVFENETTNSELDKSGNQYVKSMTKRKVEFKIEEVHSEKIIFSSVILSSNSEKPEAKIKTIFSNKFPPVVENINKKYSLVQLVSSLLCMVRLQHEIDLNSNTLKQINKEKTLEEMRSLLAKKEFDNENISDITNFIRKGNEVIQKILSYNELLLYFNQAVKSGPGELYSEFFQKSYHKTNTETEYEYGQDKGRQGTVFEKVELNDKHGFISKYYIAKYDSVTSTWSSNYLKLSETNTQYLNNYKPKQQTLTFNFKIKNPEEPVVTLFYYDKPFGEELKKEHLTLNENNNVSFQATIPGQSFVLFSSKEVTFPTTSADFIFYAEPGDTIELEIAQNNGSPKVKISGTNSTINNVLYKMDKGNKLFLSEKTYIKAETILSGFAEYKLAEEGLDIFHNYLEKNAIYLDKRIYSFIERELAAIQFLNYYSVLNLENLSNPNQIYMQNMETFRKAGEMVRNFDIHDIYNDYGLYSRMLANQYLRYYLYHLQKVNSSVMFFSGRRTISEEFNDTKMILGGTVFYRTMAARVENAITRYRTPTFLLSQNELEEAVDLLDKLRNQSYDIEFISALEDIRDKRLRWEDKSFVPNVEFYRQDGRKTTLKEFIKGKPTVLYINNDWGTHRYYWDEMAKKYPGIQFIFIVEGKNLTKWQNYLHQAEPVADQLLLIDNVKSLNDVFVRSNRMYIVYDKNGKLLDFDVNEEKAIQLAKENLEQKNEPDKSQLITIIIILGSLLFISFLIFILWRWRIRQRFRKEQQQRRLRELELTAIRSQMNPHFLFNCLNSVQNLVQQNKGREAHLYLADFAGLIRKVLQNSEKEEVSLAEELETVKQYLNLEKLRFDFDFQIKLNEGIDPHNTLVPSMLLQPFAENAVIHGLHNKPDNKKLRIEVVRRSEQFSVNSEQKEGIEIIIEDNGIGQEAAKKLSTSKNGKSSKLIQERLEILQQKQGEKYRLQITDLSKNGATGTKVEILVPEER